MLASALINILINFSQADKEIDPERVGTLRSHESSLQQISEIQQQRLQQDKDRLRTAYGIKEISNPMLSLPMDLYR